MRTIDIPYLYFRKQRSGKVYGYWEPSKKLRKQGYKSISLGGNKDKAIARAIEINASLGRSTKSLEEGTLAWLINLYRKDEKYLSLAPRSQKDYDIILFFLEEWGGSYPVQEITRKKCKELHRNILQKVQKKDPDNPNAGLRQAKYVIQVLSVVLGIAVDEGIISINPTLNMRLRSPEPRHQVWSEEEMSSFCVKANEMGRSSIALAFMLASFLGQRQSDIRSLTWGQYDGECFTIKQQKTKEVVKVYCLLELRVALEEAKKNRKSVHVVANETNNKPYTDNNFMHWVAKIRDAAGIRKELQFKDLHRTLVVKLSRAGCTVTEISSVTGHSPQSVHNILKVYFPRDEISAKHGIEKLEKYLRKIELK